VTPVFVGKQSEFAPWQCDSNDPNPSVFVSATPYFCPVHLSHGKSSGGRLRSIAAQIRRGLRGQHLIVDDDDVHIEQLVFDYAPQELAMARTELKAGSLAEPDATTAVFSGY